MTTHSFFGSDDGGLSCGPYKQVVAGKSMHNYTNNEPYDPHDFNKQVKIKYKTTKAVVGKILNGIAALIELLSRSQPVALDWAGYCALTPDQQFVWEQIIANEPNQSILYLLNSNNKLAKKDLHLAYSLGNNTAYPPNIKSIARYLSTQNSNNKPAHQHRGKRGDKRKGNDSKAEDKNSKTGGTTGTHVEDTTTTKESTAPSGGPSISAHVS